MCVCIIQIKMGGGVLWVKVATRAGPRAPLLSRASFAGGDWYGREGTCPARGSVSEPQSRASQEGNGVVVGPENEWGLLGPGHRFREQKSIGWHSSKPQKAGRTAATEPMAW